MKTHTIITSDRYIVKEIIDGTALVLQATGLCIPCKWHAKHQRLESVAINVTEETRAPFMYNLNSSVKSACAKHDWRAMTLEECEKELLHM